MVREPRWIGTIDGMHRIDLAIAASVGGEGNPRPVDVEAGGVSRGTGAALSSLRTAKALFVARDATRKCGEHQDAEDHVFRAPSVGDSASRGRRESGFALLSVRRRSHLARLRCRSFRVLCLALSKGHVRLMEQGNKSLR